MLNKFACRIFYIRKYSKSMYITIANLQGYTTNYLNFGCSNYNVQTLERVALFLIM